MGTNGIAEQCKMAWVRGRDFGFMIGLFVGILGMLLWVLPFIFLLK